MEWLACSTLRALQWGIGAAVGQNPEQLIRTQLHRFLELDGAPELLIHGHSLRLEASGGTLSQESKDGLHEATGFAVEAATLGALEMELCLSSAGSSSVLLQELTLVLHSDQYKEWFWRNPPGKSEAHPAQEDEGPSSWLKRTLLAQADGWLRHLLETSSLTVRTVHLELLDTHKIPRGLNLSAAGPPWVGSLVCTFQEAQLALDDSWELAEGSLEHALSELKLQLSVAQLELKLGAGVAELLVPGAHAALEMRRVPECYRVVARAELPTLHASGQPILEPHPGEATQECTLSWSSQSEHPQFSAGQMQLEAGRALVVLWVEPIGRLVDYLLDGFRKSEREELVELLQEGLVRASEVRTQGRGPQASLQLTLSMLPPLVLMPGARCLEEAAGEAVWLREHERMELRPGELRASTRLDGGGMEVSVRGVDCRMISVGGAHQLIKLHSDEHDAAIALQLDWSGARLEAALSLAGGGVTVSLHKSDLQLLERISEHQRDKLGLGDKPDFAFLLKMLRKYSYWLQVVKMDPLWRAGCFKLLHPVLLECKGLWGLKSFCGSVVAPIQVLFQAGRVAVECHCLNFSSPSDSEDRSSEHPDPPFFSVSLPSVCSSGEKRMSPQLLWRGDVVAQWPRIEMALGSKHRGVAMEATGSTAKVVFLPPWLQQDGSVHFQWHLADLTLCGTAAGAEGVVWLKLVTPVRTCSPLLGFSFSTEAGLSLRVCLAHAGLQVTWSGHLIRDFCFCVKAFKALKINQDAQNRHMLDMQAAEESRPLQVHYEGLCTLATEVVNLWPSFGLLNRTVAPPPLCHIRSPSRQPQKALAWCWVALYSLVSLDMFAAIAGFGFLVAQSFNCDGVYCSVSVTVFQSVPQAFFAIFMMPALLHSVLGSWSRMYGVWAGLVAWLFVSWYLSGDLDSGMQTLITFQNSNMTTHIVLFVANLITVVLFPVLRELITGCNACCTRSALNSLSSPPVGHCLEVQRFAVSFLGLIGLSGMILSFAFKDTSACASVYDGCGGYYVALSSGGKMTLAAVFNLWGCVQECFVALPCVESMSSPRDFRPLQLTEASDGTRHISFRHRGVLYISHVLIALYVLGELTVWLLLGAHTSWSNSSGSLKCTACRAANNDLIFGIAIAVWIGAQLLSAATFAFKSWRDKRVLSQRREMVIANHRAFDSLYTTSEREPPSSQPPDQALSSLQEFLATMPPAQGTEWELDRDLFFDALPDPNRASDGMAPSQGSPGLRASGRSSNSSMEGQRVQLGAEEFLSPRGRPEGFEEFELQV